ncbi:YfhD family protein [Aquibacillus koreensis]|uniref:YfhD family protein n=1 Tax=Aquibacillus koreensis TaxID=279446 RepID=A0A9X3WR18_9BACI|nr:YfhD family protein [Aquibacillus koreensis]MCT2536161.1 YfhD family protein [Aquibacillus koreensis]MDC3422086.1 YfhD family protein [Aquibacillus koreensis]
MAKKQNKEKLPVEKAEDVEFSYELADSEDLEAVERMNKADRRATQKK